MSQGERSGMSYAGAGAVILSAFAAVLFAALCLKSADGIRSPINGRFLKAVRHPGDYSFIVAGHTYGDHNASIYPSASLLGNLDLFHQPKVRFGVFLGDMLQRVTPADIEAFRFTLGSRVSVPLFNAIGNHDAGNNLYHKEFGSQTYYSFQYGSELFVVLDAEKDKGKIIGEQKAFLIREIEKAKADAKIRNIFLFTHRVVWAVDHPIYKVIVPFVNGPDIHQKGSSNFFTDFVPLLRDWKEKGVYVIAGDVGTAWSLPLFYQKDSATGITFMATGIGDTPKDLILVAHVSKGQVHFESVPLTTRTPFMGPDGKIMGAGYFGLSSWMKYFSKRESLKKK